MPILDQAAKFAANRMPKVINPTAHAVIEPGTRGTAIRSGRPRRPRGPGAAGRCRCRGR